MWCGDCRRSKSLLDTLGVDYDYVDLEEVPEAADTAADSTAADSAAADSTAAAHTAANAYANS